jgi:hypothetical protein
LKGIKKYGTSVRRTLKAGGQPRRKRRIWPMKFGTKFNPYPCRDRRTSKLGRWRLWTVVKSATKWALIWRFIRTMLFAHVGKAMNSARQQQGFTYRRRILRGQENWMYCFNASSSLRSINSNSLLRPFVTRLNDWEETEFWACVDHAWEMGVSFTSNASANC